MRRRRWSRLFLAACLVVTVVGAYTYVVLTIAQGDTSSVRYCEPVPDAQVWACSRSPVSFYWERPN